MLCVSATIDNWLSEFMFTAIQVTVTYLQAQKFSFGIGWKEEYGGFGYLWESGVMDDGATDILRDPTYANANPNETWGTDGHFNQMDKVSSRTKWSEWTSKWQSSHMNFGGARWSVPDHWNDYPVNWASSSPDGKTYTFKIFSDYATEYQPIRSSCLWNTGGAPGLPPPGDSWFNAYSHRVKGINISFTDGSAKWLNSGRINATHGSGYIHHFRNAFWRYGEEFKTN